MTKSILSSHQYSLAMYIIDQCCSASSVCLVSLRDYHCYM